MANTPIVNLGAKYINGLNLTRTDDEVIAIAAGAARDSTNDWDIVVSSALAVSNLVSGAGGIDTGTVGASKMYYVFVIDSSTRSTAAPAAGLLSLSATAPVLPFGYDVFRRVGAVLTDGTSDFLEFHQYGAGNDRPMYYDVAISELAAGNATTYTAVDLATSVPAVRCDVIALVAYTPASATNKAHFLPFGSTATNGIVQFAYGVAAAQVGMATIPSALDSGVPKIQYKVGNASDALTVSVAGYIDQL